MVAALKFSEDRRDRTPPHDGDAERELLGSVLYHPALMDNLGDLPDEAFYFNIHKLIYRQMVEAHRKGLPADLTRVAQGLTSSGTLEVVGGKHALISLLDECTFLARPDLAMFRILDLWNRRRLGEIGRKLAALQHEAGPWPKVYEQAEAMIFGLAESATQVSGGLKPLADVMGELLSEVEEQAQSEELPGISTGFYDIDAMTMGGLQPTDLVIVAGRPAMGKSAFALQMAQFVTSTTQKPVPVYSLEMSDKQLAYRLLSAESKIETSRLRTARIKDEEWEKVSGSIANLSALPMLIDDAFQPTMAHIRSECRKLVARQGELGMVLIDYLQLMDGNDDDGGGNRSQALSWLTRSLKMLARELNCPVVVLSQLNRGVEQRANKRPLMSDLKESGGIEQDADLIMMLYREEYYEPDTPDRGIAEVSLVKNRHGATGTVKLLFEPEFTRFRNLASFGS
jgi:replicative DNA helicase